LPGRYQYVPRYFPLEVGGGVLEKFVG